LRMYARPMGQLFVQLGFRLAAAEVGGLVLDLETGSRGFVITAQGAPST
jgi:hypothetical protein